MFEKLYYSIKDKKPHKLKSLLTTYNKTKPILK
jgi:hypothetical protein